LSIRNYFRRTFRRQFDHSPRAYAGDHASSKGDPNEVVECSAYASPPTGRSGSVLIAEFAGKARCTLDRRSPSGSERAIRGSACTIAKLLSSVLVAIRSANSTALASPWPSSTTYCEKPFLCTVSPIGQHHVNHPASADQARYAHRTTTERICRARPSGRA
jgi:hypothetical protein